ncbi:MAG: hypothetical protein JRG71_04910 [Deltaproteobacteria bacterium]|nr:hypothetical protein [Deltaproteobacteria bacterium]
MIDCLKKYCNFILCVTTLALTLVVVLIFFPVNYTQVQADYDYGYLADLYREVEQIKVPNENRGYLSEIIENRLSCSADSKSYRERMTDCNPKYKADLVLFAREHIRSNPLLGSFVVNSELCPVMYNICRGTGDNSKEKCIELEGQCIEFMLDKYWRGNNNSDFLSGYVSK